MAGVVTLSVEIELGWGMHDLNVFSHLSKDASAEKKALARLLDTCENTIPVTFDVVGHLFEQSCSGRHNGPYPCSWWDNDPGTTSQTDPLFYAPEFIDEIIDNPIEHEICTHTYSHILSEEMSDDILHEELRKVQNLHGEWNLAPPESIVMPRHQDVDYTILSNYGIKTIRRPIQNYGPSNQNPVSKFWWQVTRDHPACELTKTQGIVETTCTPHPSLAVNILPSGQLTPAPYFRALPTSIRQKIHYRYLMDAIEHAVATDGHTHLWTHLHNIANDQQWKAIERALKRLGRIQHRGGVEVVRMCDLPAQIE